jgi:hypothetical protein
MSDEQKGDAPGDRKSEKANEPRTDKSAVAPKKALVRQGSNLRDARKIRRV